MKKLFFLMAISCLVLPYASATTYVSADMKHATVFLSGAELTQTAKLNLQKGDNEVTIERLSPNIDRQSLQIKLPQGMIISSYEYSIDYLSADKTNENQQQLKDSVEAQEKVVRNLADQLLTTQKMLELLEQGVEHSMQVERQSITTEAIEKNIAYYNTRASQLREQVVSLEIKQTAAKELLTKLKKQLSSNQKPNAKRTGQVKLVINSPKAAVASAEIKYFTYSAVWYPSYELIVNKINEPISLIMKANVSQTTGLDWNKTALSLSTGTPARRTQAPVMSTLFVSEQQMYKAQMSRASGMAMKNTALLAETVYDEAMPAEEEDVYEAPTVEKYLTTNENQLSVQYDIDIPYTILGTGKEQTISLLQKQLKDVTYTYYTAPRYEPSVFLMAELKNWEQLQLLDGNATITYDGTFYGQTYLSANTAAQSLRLTLASDPQISVKREKVNDFTATKVVGSEKRITVAYKTTVRNNKNKAVDLVLKEQYPISQNKQIKIELLADKTTPYSQVEAEKGFLTYQLTLQPGEVKEVVVCYQVKYPESMSITNIY